MPPQRRRRRAGPRRLEGAGVRRLCRRAAHRQDARQLRCHRGARRIDQPARRFPAAVPALQGRPARCECRRLLCLLQRLQARRHAESQEPAGPGAGAPTGRLVRHPHREHAPRRARAPGAGLRGAAPGPPRVHHAVDLQHGPDRPARRYTGLRLAAHGTGRHVRTDRRARRPANAAVRAVHRLHRVDPGCGGGARRAGQARAQR